MAGTGSGIQELEKASSRPLHVMGPCGEAMGLDDLPPHDTERWVARRKAEVVYAVNGGLLSAEDAIARYRLTREEFATWQRDIDRSGLQGLQVTRLKQYRAKQKADQRLQPV